MFFTPVQFLCCFRFNHFRTYPLLAFWHTWFCLPFDLFGLSFGKKSMTNKNIKLISVSNKTCSKHQKNTCFLERDLRLHEKKNSNQPRPRFLTWRLSPKTSPSTSINNSWGIKLVLDGTSLGFAHVFPLPCTREI